MQSICNLDHEGVHCDAIEGVDAPGPLRLYTNLIEAEVKDETEETPTEHGRCSKNTPASI